MGEGDIRDIGRKVSGQVFNPVNIKIATIVVLVLVLLIPTVMVGSLVKERKWRKNDVVREISGKWGGQQTVAGPILTLPFKSWYKTDKGEDRYRIRHLNVLPRELSITGTLAPEVRYRSLYEAVLYNARVQVDGVFDYPEFSEFGINAGDVLWQRGFLALGIPDMTGIKDNIDVEMNGRVFAMNPGIRDDDVLESGVSSKIPRPARGEELRFSFPLNLNGSEDFHVVPVGEVTRLTLSSPWASPSFNGAFLPEERTIGADGFTASWKVLHLNRNFPQAWIGDQHKIGAAFGVKLFITADLYQKTTRTVKYALMFICFTFMAFFFSEVMHRIRVHPIQYLFVGLALIIFYTLLLAISEHLNFDAAYLISAPAVIALITGYAHGVFRHKTLTGTIGGILVLLYSYLYIVLQLEDFALLMGSIGLFLVLGAVMYLTRKIDWYAIQFETGRGPERETDSEPETAGE